MPRALRHDDVTIGREIPQGRAYPADRRTDAAARDRIHNEQRPRSHAMDERGVRRTGPLATTNGAYFSFSRSRRSSLAQCARAWLDLLSQYGGVVQDSLKRVDASIPEAFVVSE